MTENTAANPPTVATALDKVFAFLKDEGGLDLERGDYYAHARAQEGDACTMPTIMLDDTSDGWYIAVGIAPRVIPKGDSMALYAATMRGYINLDVALDAHPAAGRPTMTEDEILALPIRSESKAGPFWANVGLSFHREDGYYALGTSNFSIMLRIDRDTGALTRV